MRNVSNNELLNCPFCGGEAKVERYWNGKYGAECADENCSGFWSVSDTEQEAIAVWNQRAERTCHNVNQYCNFKCSVCGADFYEDSPDHYPAIENGYFNYCPNCGARVVGD